MKFTKQYPFICFVLLLSVSVSHGAEDSLCQQWSSDEILHEFADECNATDYKEKIKLLQSARENTILENEKHAYDWGILDLLYRAELAGIELEGTSALNVLKGLRAGDSANNNFLAWQIRNKAIESFVVPEKKSRRQRLLSITREEAVYRKLQSTAKRDLRVAASLGHPQAHIEIARQLIEGPISGESQRTALVHIEKAEALGYDVPVVFKDKVLAISDQYEAPRSVNGALSEVCKRWSETSEFAEFSDHCPELNRFDQYKIVKDKSRLQKTNALKQPFLWELARLVTKAEEDGLVLERGVTAQKLMKRVSLDGNPEKDYYFYRIYVDQGRRRPDPVKMLRRAADNDHQEANRELASLHYKETPRTLSNLSLALKYLNRSKQLGAVGTDSLENRIRLEILTLENQAKHLAGEKNKVIEDKKIRMLASTPENICERWARTPTLQHLVIDCDKLSDKAKYALVKEQSSIKQSSGKKRDYYWEMAQILAVAEHRQQQFDTESAARYLGFVDLGNDPEKLFLAWTLKKGEDRFSAYENLVRAAENNHPKAHLELARLYFRGEGFKKDFRKSKEYLNSARALGMEIPLDFLNEVQQEERRIQRAKAEAEIEKQYTRERKARRQAELANLDIPNINVALMDKVLHQHTISSANTTDKGLGAAMGFPDGFMYRCDNDFCYAMEGIVKFRFKVENIETCEYRNRTSAQCYFTFRLNLESGMDLGTWRGDLLRGSTSARLISGYADLIFRESNWTVTYLKGW